jgi:hypothetical protein
VVLKNSDLSGRVDYSQTDDVEGVDEFQGPFPTTFSSHDAMAQKEGPSSRTASSSIFPEGVSPRFQGSHFFDRTTPQLMLVADTVIRGKFGV